MAELIDLLGRSGFHEVALLRQFSCFAGTSKEGTARKYGVGGANVFARKKA